MDLIIKEIKIVYGGTSHNEAVEKVNSLKIIYKI